MSENLVRRKQVCESGIYCRTPIQQFSVYEDTVGNIGIQIQTINIKKRNY